jgi:signal transduction histidine kinase
MAEVSVPELGEACLIYRFLEGETGNQLAAVRHVDAARQPLLAGLAELAFREPHGLQPVLGAASTGHPVVLSQLETAQLLGDGRPAHVLLSDIGVKTAVLVPVAQDERMLAVALFLANRARYYTPLRVRLAQELISRFSLALTAAYAYQDCKTLLDGMQETLAAAIHDLSSPITYIKGTVQGLRRTTPLDAEWSPSSEISARLNAVDSAANRMASTLSGLLQATRPFPPAPRASGCGTDLVALTHRVVGLEQMIARDHSIRVNEAAAELRGAWDAAQLERMLANLIGNAVKYSPTGTCVDINVGTEVDGDGQWAVLQVTDQGVGIPARDLPFVFEPFRRGSNVGSVAGTGLGLASVWQVVKACGGRLGIDSEEGRGTSITVRLPLPDGTSS